jgi:aminoglycoside phosphotransferase (APT) family kinase protein
MSQPADPLTAPMSELSRALLNLLSGRGIRELTEPTRLGGGSSQENWAFDALFTRSDGTSSWRPLLMRRDPMGGVVDTDRDTEFALLQALNDTDLPVARAYAYDDGARLERRAMILDRLPGRAHRAVLRDTDPLKLGEPGRLRLAEALPGLLASVHRVDPHRLGLTAVLPPAGDNPARGELARWIGTLDATELEPQPALRATASWLAQHLPAAPERITLVHGDFRPANILIDNGGVSALLDWELAHLGDPHDDLGWYTCSVYRREHFLAGSFEPDDFLRAWSRETDIAVDLQRLHFWQVMSTFRLAVIALTAINAFCRGITDRPSAPADRVIAMALHETGLTHSPTANGVAS